MKKKILSGVFAFALIATAGYGGQKSLKSDANLNDLALANMEALADGEVSFLWLCQHTTPKVCIIDMGRMYLGKRIF